MIAQKRARETLVVTTDGAGNGINGHRLADAPSQGFVLLLEQCAIRPKPGTVPRMESIVAASLGFIQDGSGATDFDVIAGSGGEQSMGYLSIPMFGHVHAHFGERTHVVVNVKNAQATTDFSFDIALFYREVQT